MSDLIKNVWRHKSYVRLRGKLEINRDALDDDVIELPMVVQEISEIVELASIRVTAAKTSYAEVYAAAGAALRDTPTRTGKPASEASITARAPFEEGVPEAAMAVKEAEASFALWKRLLDSFRVKQSSIKRLSEFILAGYMSNSSVTDSIRNRVQEKRNEGAPLPPRRTQLK